MDSTQKSCELSQSVKSSLKINYKKRNWNCATSQAFLKSYILDLNGPTQDENRRVTRSTASSAKRVKLDHEEPPAWKYQVNKKMKTISWREKLCNCDACLKMYEKYNVEFLFFIKNIEYLPTEILLKIFKHLLPSDRKMASECCKRFLDIWLCDDFLDDRRLVFDRCVLDPAREPLSVFMKSSRVYHTLAFGDVRIRGDSVFIGKFAENVTTVELMKTVSDEHVNEILTLLSTFPNLKTIRVADGRLLGDFSNVPTTIELLVISGYCGDKLNKMKLYLDKTSDSFRLELNDMAKQQIFDFTESQRNKIQSIHLRLYRNYAFKLPRFDNLKHLKLDFDECCDYGTKDVLDNLEEQCPALKNLSIKIFNRLPHKNWTCLKTLEAWSIPKEEMSRLSIFESLKELTFFPKDWDSFFVHDGFLNKNLKTFKPINNRIGCFTCIQTMTKSFPNLESLRYTCDDITNDHLEELAANTPKLKCLKLGRVDASVSFAYLPNLTELEYISDDKINDIETLPFMLRLQKLDFKLTCLNFETVKMFERMPAMEYLSIDCDVIDGDQLAVFDALTKPLKRLKKINFKSTNWIRPEIQPKIIDAMARNCKYLQGISFNNFGIFRKIAREEILKLLQKHSSLRCINKVWLKEAMSS